MTSPEVVGQVAVEVVAASARSLAKSLKKEIEGAFRDLDLKSAIRDAIGKQQVKLPVEADVDTSAITRKVRGTRAPKVPVTLDPLLTAFQAEMRRQVNALAKTVNAKVPIGADTDGLRQQLRAELAAVQGQLKAQVPVEPSGRIEYEAKLRALVDRAASSVKANVKVDVDKNSGLAILGTLIKGIGKGLPNFGGIAGQISDLGGALQKAAGSSAQLGGSLVGAATSAAGPIGVIIGLLVTATAVMTGLSTAAALAVPAMAALAGAAAAIPAALAGAGAAVGTLLLGFKGISAAFKPKTGGGGGSASDPAAQARRIAAAERGVEAARRGQAAATRSLLSAERGYGDAIAAVGDAQKRYLVSQQAVNRARKEAVEDIDDLNRSLRGAKLSEEDAALGVEEALRALNEAKLTGQIPDIKRADLAYREALQTLDEAKDTTQDLQEATEDANTKGVEGSDKVQSALADQADALKAVEQAQEGVLSAQDALLSAQDGVQSANDSYQSSLDSLADAHAKVGASAAAAAANVVKLAPAAQRFVDAVKALKPAFEGLRLDVQQRLFQGLDQTVTHLGDTWIPALKVTLGRYADTFNGFFRNLGASITTPKFIADIQAGAEGARQGISKISDAITGKLAPAFGALSRAAGPFLAQLGQEVADIVTQFSDWVIQGERTGGLKSFFTTASEALHDIFTTGKLVTTIVGQIIAAIIGPGAGGEKSNIDSFNDALQQLSNWLADPQHQQQIHGLITDLGSLVGTLADFGDKVSAVTGWLDRVFPPSDEDKASAHGSGIGRALVAGIIAGIAEWVKLVGRIAYDILVRPIVDAVKFLFGIRSPSTVFAAIGGQLVAGLFQGIVDTVGGLGRALRYVWDVTTGFFSNAGNWLYNAGRAVIDGLIRGIQSTFSALGSFLGGVGAFIQAHKGPLDADRKLLVGAGQAIMGGLITGISDRKTALAAELADVTSLVGNTSIPGLGVDADLALTRSLQAASTQQLVASWAPGARGDKILDGLRDLIKFTFRGDSVAALSTG